MKGSPKRRGACSLLATALLLALPAAQAVAAQPKPPKIADYRPVDLRLDGRNLAANGAQAPLEIRSQDAAFVKVQFDQFNLPKGVTLEVSNEDGSEVYRYGKDHRDGFTWDAALGQDGKTRFSAMSITGPVARIKLVGTPQEPWTSQHGVKISRVLEGFPEAMLEELSKDGLLSTDVEARSICGTDDKKAVACYVGQDDPAVDRTRPIAKMLISGGGACTAWRVGASNRMFTNNHCTATQSGVAGSEFWFNYQRSTCSGSQGQVVKVSGDQLLSTNANLDYTLFTVRNFDSIAQFGYLGLDVREPTLNEKIFIGGHPGGRMKELAIASDKDGTAGCRVNNPRTNGNGGGVDMGYYCDTEGGNSGSPVLARSSLKAIALHHLGGCLNQGARMALIWPKVSSHFGGQVPDGDNGGGGNKPPVAGFNATPNGRTVAFADTSSDPDGRIAKWSWNFGDSQTSTQQNPSHTYAADGTYTVTLEVTDDKGASARTSKQVEVKGGTTPGDELQNGKPVSNLEGDRGSERVFTMKVPAGARSLRFALSGGSGDADLYVKFGEKPTTSSYDCRPYRSGNNETCDIASVKEGTYYVMLRGYSSYSGASLVGSYSEGGQTYPNEQDFAIGDLATVESPVTVSGRSGNASATSVVDVDVSHTYTGDLRIDLVAPDGSVYNLHNRQGGSADNVKRSFTVDLSSEPANGTWKLRVNDAARGDTGVLNRWALAF